MILTDIQIVIHYRYSALPYPVPPREYGNFASACYGRLVEAGLLRYDPADPQRCYEITARGIAYVEAIRELPLPEQRWVMPSA